MELHYSQTVFRFYAFSFFVLLSYGITLLSNLIRVDQITWQVLLSYGITLLSNGISILLMEVRSFTIVWNYTTLKHPICHFFHRHSFTIVWNYTTLKLFISSTLMRLCFTIVWNYTTLKRKCNCKKCS